MFIHDKGGAGFCDFIRRHLVIEEKQTSGAEAPRFLALSRRPEGLLHPVAKTQSTIKRISGRDRDSSQAWMLFMIKEGPFLRLYLATSSSKANLRG
jgi:hypothetical protein